VEACTLIQSLEDQSRVVTTEPERIVQREPDFAFFGDIGDVVEITFGIGVLEVDCRWNNAMLDRQNTGGAFHSASTPEQVAGH